MAIRQVALAGLSREQLLGMYEEMLLIRRFEEKAAEEYTKSKIGGFMHLYIGQEALGVGAIATLNKEDKVISHYREHGQAISKGVSPRAVMAELFGRIDGCSKGKGGSMHIHDEDVGMLGGYAIVGAQIVLACGLAFAAKYQNQNHLIMTFFGDGAVDEGAFHEGLNLASLWKLPVVYICENNQYSMGMAVQKAWSVSDLSTRAAAYSMPYEKVDGMDLIAVYEACKRATERARSGEGPTLLECKTYRFRGHSMTDPAYYRTRDEAERWRASQDPISLFLERLREGKLIKDDELKAIEDRVDAVVQDAVDFADASPEPPMEELYTDIMMDDANAISWRYPR
ncbi:MAG TPA: pyruvate dehydrogenase (acetyl-transferring) E1 component subunit alpha [Ktedonobacterales bacterium]|nr:pyruvate dehydrogenase (acetyl-transferring) E1 component subunit alpha [Ktedonobacterales bacterium]